MRTDRWGSTATLGVAFLCCLMAIALEATPARAGGIFDDTWTPPARKTPAKTSETRTARSPADTPAAAQPARRPIPGKLDQARSRDNLKQVFGADMQDSSLPGRRKLAAKLFDAVAKTADNPVDQYVLLGGAINAAKEGANLRLCVQIADFLSQMFEVDGVAIKADAALNMNLRGGSPADAAANAAAGLEVLDLLMAEDEFTTASKLNVQLRGLTAAVPSLATTIQQKSKELEAFRQEHDRVVQQLAVLKTKPDDPAANLAAGKYYCFRSGDWAKGLPYLAKGSDADLKKAAEDELSGPKSAKENELVGDGWWAVGERQADSIRKVINEHALVFYKVAIPNAVGLGRIKMQERIGVPNDDGKAGPATGETASLAYGGLPVDADGKPLNFDFEDGTLRDWTATGDAFQGQPIRGDTVAKRRAGTSSNLAGNWWIGTFEVVRDRGRGTLTSVCFKATRPWATFLVGGGSRHATRVEIVRKSGGVIFTASGRDAEEMRRVAVDLRPVLGEEIFVRIVDEATGPWGHINFDDFRFQATDPKSNEAQLAGPNSSSVGGSAPPVRAADSADAVARSKLLQIVKEIEALYLRRNQGGRAGFFVGGQRGAPGHPGSKAEMDNVLALMRTTAGQAAPITPAEVDSLLKSIARARSQVEADDNPTHAGGTGEEAANFIEQRLDQVATELRAIGH